MGDHRQHHVQLEVPRAPPATVMVMWFPATRAATIIKASDMTGFTFPGMIELPG